MWYGFFLQNLHFALNLFAAVDLLLVSWLYFDTFSARKSFRTGLKVLGTLLISLSYFSHATGVEVTTFESLAIDAGIVILLTQVLRIMGLSFLSIGLLLDPVSQKPKHNPLPSTEGKALALLAIPGTIAYSSYTALVSPILLLVVSLQYGKAGFLNLEAHLKKAFFGFFALFLSELIHTVRNLVNTTNVDLFELLKPFGPVWVIDHLIFAIGVLIIANWSIVYLLKRLTSQLFVVFTQATILIFSFTTIAFSGLLINNIRTDALKRLELDTNVLKYALDNKKEEMLSNAEVLAQDPQVIAAVAAKDHKVLAQKSEQHLVAKKQTSMLIVDFEGRVIARGEGNDKVGNSLSNDPLVKAALLGSGTGGITVKEGVLSPEIILQGAAPIKNQGEVIGAVVSGTTIDNAFIDGLKKATGFEASIYSGNVVSATTSVLPGTTKRLTGLKEENKNIKKTVLLDGKPYLGTINLANSSHLAAFVPLFDANNNVIGMLSIGTKEIEILGAAARSIQLTFVISVVLILLFVVPSILVSKHLSDQLR